MTEQTPKSPHQSRYMDLVTPLGPGEQRIINHTDFLRRREEILHLLQSSTPEEAATLLALREVTDKIKIRHLTKRSYIDWLTDIANRRGFEEEFANQVYSGVPFILLYIDADGLKEKNTNHGHEAGNQYIRHITTHAKDVLWQNVLRTREQDPNAYRGIRPVILARIGGDEIGAIITFDDYERAAENPDGYFAEKEQIAFELAEEFRNAVAQNAFTTHDQQTNSEIALFGSVSIGVGVCHYDTTIHGFKTHVDQQGLHAAKSAGRNRTVLVQATANVPAS